MQEKKQPIKVDIKLNSLLDLWRFRKMLKQMRRNRQMIIWEANMDKLHMQTNYASELVYDETEDRKVLADENRKPIEQQDKARINSIEDKIAMAKAVKLSYRKNEEAIKESQRYIQLIDDFFKNGKTNFTIR